jgi:P4 family phage/plasmid primase-like protien
MDALKIYNDHELSKFLSNRRTQSKDPSFTAMGKEIKGKWLIEEKDSEHFYNLLNDYLFVKKGRALSIVEQPRLNESKPLMIDLDFHYPVENNLVRTFSKSNIFEFCKDIGESTITLFEASNPILRFFVTMRKEPYIDSKKQFNKDGIHIMCPDMTLLNEKQKALRNYVLQENYLATAFENTGYNNKDKEVYDESMTRKQGWLPYGESKPNVPPYLLAYVFTLNTEDNTWNEEPIDKYSSRELIELLSIRYNIEDDTNDVKEGYQQLYNELITPEIEEEETKDTMQPQVVPINILKECMINSSEKEQIDLISRLVLECLNKTRADSYDDWMRLGWALHNIEASEQMFNLWMEFSSFSPKFKHNDMRQTHKNFQRMRQDGDGPRLTERSLHKWAKHDNPELYQKIIDESIVEYVRQKVEGTHHHIAMLLKKLYNNNYVASINNRNTDWYWYDDIKNMWVLLNQGVQLKNKISTEVANYITKVEEYYNHKNAMSQNESEKKFYQDQAKRFVKIKMNLYTNGFVESTMKMAEGKFRDENFTNKLNSNPYLFACKNGVLELRVTKESGKLGVIFRQGIPEDYLSFLGGFNFNETEAIEYKPYDTTNPIYEEINDFLSKIFPDKSLRDYELRLLASCLEGTNKEQCYYTWNGVGGNGKSKLVDLMRFTFGDYQTSLQATALTRKRPESGAANPEIIAIKNRRFIYLQEPDDKEPLNTSRMKQFSGEDMIEARKLYGDQEKFKLMGKMFMMCNSMPIIKTMDRGTWRRIRVIPFVSKFVDPTNPEYIMKRPNVFLRDNDLDKKLIKWREAFLSLLVHIYETEYLVNGLEPIPEIVIKVSNEYKESNDSYAKFSVDRIRRTPTDFEAKVYMKDIKKSYDKWIEATSNVARRLSPQDLQNRVNEEFGEPSDKKTYLGIKIFMTDEEVDDWEKEQKEEN